MYANRSSLAREWLVIALLTFVGAILRFWEFGHICLDHFDEGIYSFSGFWIASDDGPFGLAPMVISYAPPVLPILIGLS